MQADSLRAALNDETPFLGIPDDTEQVKLRQELCAAVEAAFVTRQKLQHSEVDSLQRRLQEVQKSIQAREENKEAIIQHRIEEPPIPAKLQWDTTDVSNRARSVSEGVAESGQSSSTGVKPSTLSGQSPMLKFAQPAPNSPDEKLYGVYEVVNPGVYQQHPKGIQCIFDGQRFRTVNGESNARGSRR